MVWDKATGKPIHNAIVWQDTRTDAIINDWQRRRAKPFSRKLGLPLATYFSGPKIKWLLDDVPGRLNGRERGELLFGNIDTWLIWNLTGGKTHVTDVTNASRTMLMNLKTLDWDDDCCGRWACRAPCCPRFAHHQKFMALPRVVGWRARER